MKKELAFKEAINLATKDVYLCNKEKVVKPIQAEDFAELLKDEKSLLEKYTPEIYDVFSNHLALNFSFVQGGKVLDVTERHAMYDYEFINAFRSLLERNSLENPSLKKSLLSALVRHS